MVDRNQAPEPKNMQRPMPQPDRSDGDRLVGEAHETRNRRRIVGEDVPDESKERHTEIAVEAGHQSGGRRDE